MTLATQLARELAGTERVDTAPLAEMLTDPRTIFLGAQVQGAPAGYLVAYTFPSLGGERLAYLYNIEVAHSYRRRGVARAMVHELMSVCRDAGVGSVWVGSSLTNHAACALWRATGAQQDGDRYVEFTFELSDV